MLPQCAADMRRGVLAMPQARGYQGGVGAQLWRGALLLARWLLPLLRSLCLVGVLPCWSIEFPQKGGGLRSAGNLSVYLMYCLLCLRLCVDDCGWKHPGTWMG